jgi:type IV pilus assembly protein PilY1
LSTETDNGLSTPTLVDSNQDGFVDLIYAGDLQGNLWRIDATNADPRNWTGKKLFTAPKTAANLTQPITSAPQVTRHPNGGLMILFGTGKYLETSDTSVIPPVQALYGIRDVTPESATVVTQTISNLNAVSVTGTGATRSLPISSGATDAQCKTDKGWYINLTKGQCL